MFGDVLKRVMAEKKISQNQLAIEIEVSQCNISQYVRNVITPNYTTFKKICKALDVSADVFINEVDD